jgi:hypothetical protein
MNRHASHIYDWFPLLLTLCCAVASVTLLSACAGDSRQTGDSGFTAVSQLSTEFTSTNTPDSRDTNTPTGKDLFNTRVAQHMAAIATEAALSPRPTPPQGPIYLRSPVPTATWATGYFGGLDNVSPYDPEYISCWNGYLNTNLMEVCAGHQQPLGGDPQQGMLQIGVWEQDQETLVTLDNYKTPEKVGVMHIVVAGNNSVTIASEDGQHLYTFDIATRHWVPNPPSVLPSASP